MERQAKFIAVCENRNRFDRHAWQHTDLMYKYRGYTYIVTKHNNGYAFDGLAAQHRQAQKDIDERIERESKPVEKWEYEGSAQQAFDEWYDEMYGEDK